MSKKEQVICDICCLLFLAGVTTGIYFTVITLVQSLQ